MPESKRGLHIQALLTDEAQLAAHSLPPTSHLSYGAVKKAVLERVGLTPKQRRQSFWEMALGEADKLFTFVQRLLDA